MASYTHRFTAKERRLLGLNGETKRKSLLDAEGIGPRHRDGTRLDNGTTPTAGGQPAGEPALARVDFPAVLVLARWDHTAGKVLAFTDNRILENDDDLAARLRMYRYLEESGGSTYEITLAPQATADRVLAQRRAAIEAEHNFAGPTPTPAPDPEDQLEPFEAALLAAREAFADDPAALSRLESAALMVKIDAVLPAGPGRYLVADLYHVGAHCDCVDHTQHGIDWCVHRLAVALRLKVRQIEEARATGATAG